ncbi:hypothetical protein VINI7043_15879 [Vibrio nigripulchritudo ATCC 27043]|nr:hypothetical protein VINI7043_15879 [Vibrio nigripulchritudo ATCC 27043]
MIDGSYLPKDEQQEIDTARIMYVGFTRATKNLLTTYHRENKLSQQLEQAIT